MDRQPVPSNRTEPIATSLDNNLYRFIVAHSHIGIFIIDDRFRVIFSNREMKKITGYRVDELIGKDFRGFVSETFRDKVSERYRRRQQGEPIPDRYEAETIRKDGTRKTVEVSVAVTKAFSDQTISIVQVFDITERKYMEAEIQKSQQKYRDIFHNVFDVIFIHDLHGVFKESNAHYVKELGGTRDYLVGKHIKDIMSEPFHAEFEDYLKRIEVNGKDEGLFTITIPEGGKTPGEQRTLEYRNFMVYDERGKPLEVWGSARDITEKIRDKKALKASEEKYRTIVQNIDDIYFELDLKGSLQFFNDALINTLGYAREEALGMHYSRYIIPKDLKQASNYFRAAFRTEKTGDVPHYRVRKKDGTIIDVEIVATIIKDNQGTPSGFRGIARDITQRKQAEAILLESERRFREIIQGTPLPTFVIDKYHQITHWNKACEDLTGISAEAMVHTTHHWKPFYREKQMTLADLVLENKPDRLIQKQYPFSSKTSKTVRGAFEVENFFPMLGITGKWLFLTAAPLKDSEGRITGAIQTLLDITEKKAAEQKLLEMRGALEMKVQQRTQGLEEANVALKVLLKKRESDREELGRQMVTNIREIIIPYIERLKTTPSREMRRVLIEIIERNLEDITAPFLHDLASKLHKLTPSEIQIINFIKYNKTTKEIAELLGISPRTVETHRDNIRKKLGIKQQKINLKSYLLSISQKR